MKVVIGIPLSHGHLWLASCLSRLNKFDPGVDNVKIVVVDNSWEWATAGLQMGVLPKPAWAGDLIYAHNDRASCWHGTALDYVVEHHGDDADWLFAMETDVLTLQDGWLKYYMDVKGAVPTGSVDTTFAVGHWHGEQFINPSATLYNMAALRDAFKEFRANKDPNMYWGENFEKSENIIPHYTRFLEDVGPFSEKRGWPPGSIILPAPTGQLRGPGWYEPGQQVYHWSRLKGMVSYVLPCNHVVDEQRMIPTGTFYGPEPYYLVHAWGGTRALDILKHPVSDPTVINHMGYWLMREAKVFQEVVPEEVQADVISIIKKHGWFNRAMTEREIGAVKTIEDHYRKGGIEI